MKKTDVCLKVWGYKILNFIFCMTWAGTQYKESSQGYYGIRNASGVYVCDCSIYFTYATGTTPANYSI